MDVVREWACGRWDRSSRSARAGIEKRVVVDFFPAYDEDGGLLLALTPR
jgi:hypothetical protein